jgi:hypothetical protein
VSSLLSHLDRSPFLATYPPPSSVAVDHTLALNCLVLGDDPSHLFPVEIANTKTVGALKEEIWKKKENAFKGVDADTLVLWKVSFADENLQQGLAKFDPANADELRRAATRLNNVFPNQPQDQHLHMLIQRPPTREFSFIGATVYLHADSPPCYSHPFLQTPCCPPNLPMVP